MAWKYFISSGVKLHWKGENNAFTLKNSLPRVRLLLAYQRRSTMKFFNYHD